MAIVIGFLALLIIGAGAYFFFILRRLPTISRQISIPEQSDPAEWYDITPTPATQSFQESTEVTNQKKYVSPRLGVSFLYLEKTNEVSFAVKEQDNKIYIYQVGTAAENGQYLEMFSKPENRALEDEIKSRFLVNTPSYCQVKPYPANMPTPYESVAIIIPPSEASDMGEIMEKAKQCPSPYTTTNGISYFLSHSAHPDKYIFLSIGQYGIPSDTSNATWQSTIQFL